MAQYSTPVTLKAFPSTSGYDEKLKADSVQIETGASRVVAEYCGRFERFVSSNRQAPVQTGRHEMDSQNASRRFISSCFEVCSYVQYMARDASFLSPESGLIASCKHMRMSPSNVSVMNGVHSMSQVGCEFELQLPRLKPLPTRVSQVQFASLNDVSHSLCCRFLLFCTMNS